MPAPPDRPTHPLEIRSPGLPLAPLNISCSSGFERGVMDIRWSGPHEMQVNTAFDLVGVNIYRSFDSEYGPWTRLNVSPVGSTYWRDKTEIVLAMQEDVSNQFFARGDTDPDGRWSFRVRNRPLHLQPAPGSDVTNLNVYVTIDGIPAFVEHVNGPTGEIELRNYPSIDVASQKLIPAVLPKAGSVVLATYKHVTSSASTNLGRRVFYIVTTVAVDPCGVLLETPLDRGAKCTNVGVEKIDYIWHEAVRRNRFILHHGGERVKFMIRKSMGVRCGCYSYAHGQPKSDCLVCYATGFIGGYDGPYDGVIAPDNGERGQSQSNRGYSQTHSYETWTGPSPALSQRDMIVKLNGDRYGIGPVSSPSNRGMHLQQSFTISHIDETDIRYDVPVMDTSSLVAPRTNHIVPGEGGALPMISEREAIPDERETRGNTVIFENYNRR